MAALFQGRWTMATEQPCPFTLTFFLYRHLEFKVTLCAFRKPLPIMIILNVRTQSILGCFICVELKVLHCEDNRKNPTRKSPTLFVLLELWLFLLIFSFNISMDCATTKNMCNIKYTACPPTWSVCVCVVCVVRMLHSSLIRFSETELLFRRCLRKQVAC